MAIREKIAQISMKKIVNEIENTVREKFNSNWTIGISTLIYPHDPVMGIKEITGSDLGVKRIELGLGLPLEDNDKVDRLIELREKYELEYSVHVPFLYDDLAHPHPDVRRAYTNEAIKSIDLCTLLDAPDLVLHPGHLSINHSLPDVKALGYLKKPREYYLENSLSALVKIASYNKLHNINLLIENLPFGLCDHATEVNNFLSRVSGSHFILDVGHANISGTLDQLLDLKPNYFHLHDNHGKQDQHMRLGKGNLDFTKVFKAAVTNKGQQTMTLELYSIEDIVKSLQFIREKIREI